MFCILWFWTYLSYTRNHRSVWIHQNTWRDYVAVYRKGNAPEMCFNKKTTPNTWVSEQHHASRQKGLRRWSGQLNPLTSTPLENAVSEAKPKNSQELLNVVCSSWAEILVSRCQKLVDSMQCRCAAVIKNGGVYTTSSVNEIKLQYN